MLVGVGAAGGPGGPWRPGRCRSPGWWRGAVDADVDFDGDDDEWDDDDEPTDEEEVRRLRRSVGIEVLIAVVILAITAMLVNAAPARVGGDPAGRRSP